MTSRIAIGDNGMNRAVEGETDSGSCGNRGQRLASDDGRADRANGVGKSGGGRAIMNGHREWASTEGVKPNGDRASSEAAGDRRWQELLLNVIIEQLPIQKSDDVGSLASVTGFCHLFKSRKVKDAVETYQGLSTDGRPFVVIQIADPCAPMFLHRAMSTAREVRSRLGSELGEMVIEPICGGVLEGRSYAVWPWRRPMAQQGVAWRLCRPRVRSAVLEWLRGSALAAAKGERSEQVRERYRESLSHVIDSEVFSAEQCVSAKEALERLASGKWRPVSIIDHNDLWRGNIHWNIDGSGRRCGRSRFVIIDWGGANVDGFGFFDLVRWARSTDTPRTQLSREIATHAEILGIELRDTSGHLLAALGRLAVHREHFPMDRLKALVSSTWDRFLSATL